MIRPEHQFYIRPDLRKAASTKAESTTAESAIRPKQLVRPRFTIAYENMTGFFSQVHWINLVDHYS